MSLEVSFNRHNRVCIYRLTVDNRSILARALQSVSVRGLLVASACGLLGRGASFQLLADAWSDDSVATHPHRLQILLHEDV